MNSLQSELENLRQLCTKYYHKYNQDASHKLVNLILQIVHSDVNEKCKRDISYAISTFMAVNELEEPLLIEIEAASHRVIDAILKSKSTTPQ